MKRKRLKIFIYFAKLVAVSGVLGFLFAQILVHSLMKSWIHLEQSTEYSNPKSNASIDQNQLEKISLLSWFSDSKRIKDQERASKKEDYSAILLIDTIISMVRNYYVDLDRDKGTEIIFHTLDILRDTIDFKSIPVGDKKEYLLVDSGRESKILPIPDHKDSIDTTAFFYQLSTYVHDHLKYTQSKSIKASPIKLKVSESTQSRLGLFAVMNAFLASLDSHSSLLNSEAFAELKEGTEGEFGGLGIVVGVDKHLLTVLKAIPSSPAFKSGILAQDKILSINGFSTFGYGLDDLVERMHGQPGSEVKLSLLRDGEMSTHEIKLTREIIKIESVESKMIPSPLGQSLYLKIEGFSSHTADDIKHILSKTLAKHKNLIGIIIDLRSNPGGLLDQAVQISDIFLRDGVIVSTHGRKKEVEMAQGIYPNLPYPITVLINEESASASEIVAGALQDNNRAIVIGRPSYGKGSVQTVFELPEDTALKLTVARYHTPSGKSIQNIGIQPDIWIQDVYKLPENRNLFGSYRYHNEAFTNPYFKYTRTPHELLRSQWKGYHLVGAMDSQKDTMVEKDPEIHISISIFEKLTSLYRLGAEKRKAIPKDALRATQILQLNAKNIDNILSTWTDEAQMFLAQTHKLDWTTQVTPESEQAQLHLRVMSVDKNKVKKGDLVKVALEIENSSPTDINRVSVFIRPNKGYDTYEKILGKIPAHSKRQEIIDYQVHSILPSGKIIFETGTVSDAVINTPISASNRFSLTIEDQKSPIFIATSRVEEEIGGYIRNELEAKEQTKLRINIVNTSDIDAEIKDIHLYNLSGKQISLKKIGDNVRVIPSHSQAFVYADVIASSVILNRILQFGLLIETKNSAPYMQTLDLVSYPSREISEGVIITLPGQ